jgi:MraZ protein
MIIFKGEHDCKVDIKGRIVLPISFRRQMGEVETFCFVVKKNLYDECLELCTIDEWEFQVKPIMSKINPTNREDLQFFREFRMDATEVKCDFKGRLLIPRCLLSHAKITDEAVLTGGIGKIEIWSPTNYYSSGGSIEARRERTKRIY